MISQTNSYKYKIVANGITLDVFDNESIKISNNITELFDIGTLPSSITNNIDIPGSKNNNDFFKHYYDISIYNADSYTTNKKISCYIETNGLYVMEGYLMLNYVNLTNTKVESYNITIFSNLSLFGATIKNKYLSDLTSLNIYNHNLTLNNIKNSWSNQLFNGEIVYPLADYGQKIYYTNANDGYGIDEIGGALSVQDFKPSLKVKTVFDAIFKENGYTYESIFLENSGYLNNAYMFLNKTKRYPIFDGIDLENYGCFTLKPPKTVLQQVLTYNTNYKLPWFLIENNENSLVVNNNNTNIYYTINKDTILRGNINLNFKIYDITSGRGVPQFTLILTNGTNTYNIDLKKINDYMLELKDYYIKYSKDTEEETYTLLCDFYTSSKVVAGSNYEFYIKYTYNTANNFKIMIDADDTSTSYLNITKQLNIADDNEVVITNQFPVITQYDFIKSLQKKFNLIIYQSKTTKNHFIIETFNDWYKRNVVYNFNNYIDLNNKIKITPANNIAYKKLTFKDKSDNDYVSKTFKEKANRDYGLESFDDTSNNYSSDELTIETNFSSSPLSYVNNSISIDTATDNYEILTSLYGKVIGNRLVSKYLLVQIYSIYGNKTINNNGDFSFKLKVVYQPMYITNPPTYTTNLVCTFPNGVDNFSFLLGENMNIISSCITNLPAFASFKTGSTVINC